MKTKTFRNSVVPANDSNTAEVEAKSKTRRVPLSTPRDLLACKGLPSNLHARWVNDVGDRIQRFLDAGYTFYTDKRLQVGDRTVNPDRQLGTVISKNVNPNSTGSVAYLMVIDQKLYEDDQQLKFKETDDLEETIKNPSKEGQYGKTDISFIQ